MVNMPQLNKRAKSGARFKSADFGLEDEECPGQLKTFEDAELKAILEEGPCQTQE